MGKTKINEEKLKQYLQEEKILEFGSAKECMEYFNTYDYQNFQAVEEMKEYQGEYGFGIGEKWYHIDFDEALDVREELEKEQGVIPAFREKTEECFHELGGYRASEIEDLIRKDVLGRLEEAGLSEEITLVDLVISGSRCRGYEREDSDLDVVLEFSSDTWREDSLFDLLHEEEFSIDGIPVDINPIMEGKSGILEAYLPGVEEYLIEQEQKENAALLRKAEELNGRFGCFAWIGKDAVSLPAEYNDSLSDHEQRRLCEVLLKEQKKPRLEEKIKSAAKACETVSNKDNKEQRINRSFSESRI